MAVVFGRVDEKLRSEMVEKSDQETLALLRPLDHRARRVLGLFATDKHLRTSYMARLLGISPRQTRDLVAGWVQQGWLEVADDSRKGRKYQLAEAYRILIV